MDLLTLAALKKNINNSNSGSGSGESNVMLINTTYDSEHDVYIPIDTTYEDVIENLGKKEIIVVCDDIYMRFSCFLMNTEDVILFTGFSNNYDVETEIITEIYILTTYWFKDSGISGFTPYPIWTSK